MTKDWLTIKNTPWALGLLLLLSLLIFRSAGLPDRLESWLYDQAITTWPAQVSDQVAVVAIDEYSLSQLGRWPWPRKLHAQLIDQLYEAGAETVVIDLLFQEPHPDDPTLAAAMSRHGGVALPVFLSASPPHQLIREQLPTPELAAAASALGHVHVELDKDSVARGIYLRNGMANRLWPTLALAQQSHHLPLPENDIPAYVNIRADYRKVPLAGAAGTIPSTSYAAVLEGTHSDEMFTGKTVFVGATAAGFGDILPTPFSGFGLPMSGVEFQANIFSADQQRLLISESPEWASFILSILVVTILAVLLPRLTPTYTLVTCMAIFSLMVAGYLLMLFYLRIQLPIIDTLLLILFAIPIATGYRLAMTNRFLNQQLDDMASIPHLSLPQPAKRQPAQLLEHFQAFLEPEGWLLWENGELLQINGMTMAQAPHLPEPGQWVHQLNQSWVKLERGSSTYVLGLTLKNDLSREVIQQYLRGLELESDKSAHSIQYSVQAFSPRLEKVQLANKRLSQMQSFIQHSFEHMPDGIIVTDELAVVRFANRHIEDWFREPMPSLSGMPLIKLLQGHDPKENPAWHEIVSETLTLNESRTVNLKVHGRDFILHLAPVTLPGDGQSGIIANLSDISELREQQRQHRQVIDFISHDVRSPLVSQLALIAQLKRDPSNINEYQVEQLGKLARRSYSLAEEFVNLARAEQLSETRFYDCDLLAIVENARDSVSEQAYEKHIRLELNDTDDLWLQGNAELLERAVINLLTNAIQYSAPNTTITIQVYQAGHIAGLAIADEGSGIDERELPYLFDRYHRQRHNEIAGDHGTGLGLAFVKTVVEKHKGKIYVDSMLGEGTTFTLKLPIADPMG